MTIKTLPMVSKVSRTGLLLSHPIGLVFTAIGVMMIGVGSYFIKKIVTIEV